MGTLGLILSLVQPALSVFGAFKGSAAEAKANAAVQDALGVITSLTPLIQQFGEGKEVSPEDVRVALASSDKALSDLDAAIAAARAAGR